MVRGIPDTSNISWSRRGNNYIVFIVDGKSKVQLASGRTLIEALMMRDWCREHGWIKFVYPRQYIQELPCGTFQVFKDFKQADGTYRREHYGCFRSLESAIKERDWLIECNWDLELACDLG